MFPTRAGEEVAAQPRDRLITVRHFHWSRSDFLAAAALAAAIAIFFWPLLTPDLEQRRYIVAGDFTNQFYPYHFFAASEWWSGRVPLWNPYMFGGHPFQADIQTGTFYPVSLLFHLFAARDGLPYWALELQGVVDYLLAAIFSYLFLRSLLDDRLAAFLGAVCYALGGYLTSYPFQQLAVLETAIWLPLVLLLIELGARDRRRALAWPAAAGITMAIAIFGGHPQSALFVAYTALAYLLYRSWCFKQRWPKTLAAAATFLIVACAGAAVQLLPTFELTALSTRAALAYDIAASGYDYVALPGLLLPDWRGEKALYLGVVPLLLAILVIARRRPHPVLFWAIVAVVALALSFGDRGFLYRPLHALAPGFATFKGQERAALVFSFAAAVLAAYGYAGLRSGSLALSRRAVSFTGLGLAAGGGLAVVLFWGQNDVVGGTTVDLARAGYFKLLFLVAIVMGLLLLVRRADKGNPFHKRTGAVAALALVVLAGADLAAANWQNNMTPTDPTVNSSQRAAVDFLLRRQEGEGEPLRVRPQDDRALPANYGAIARLPLAAGDSPIVVQRTEDLFSSPEEWRLWQLLNVKYAVGSGQTSEALEEVFDAAPLKVYRNRYSLPRAWVVEDLTLVSQAADAKQAVLARAFDPGNTVVLERAPQLAIQPARVGDAVLEQHIRFDHYSPRRLYLHTETNRNGLLVLSEIYYPGWRAKLDGVPVPIHRVDYIIRGVELPVGEHELEMVFDPPLFWLGLAISATTFLFLVVYWLWLGLRRGTVER